MYKTIEIKEGLGSYIVSIPHSLNHIPRRSDQVFFNPHQEINRDISVLTLRAYAKQFKKEDLTVCEPLCGSGIRSCRYAQETPSTRIYSSDLNPIAIDIARKNIERLPSNLSKRINLFNMECNEFLQKLNIEGTNFDFIDIDPYGTPIPFVQNSIHVITLQGVLAFTATDLATLVGVYPKALYAKYGVSYFDRRIGNVHELAARALITGIQHVGLNLNQSLLPILTFYYRHFIRTFFLRRRGVDHVLNDTGFINYCSECQSRYTSMLNEKRLECHSCGSSVSIKVGPIYLGPILQKETLSELFQDEHLLKLGTSKKLIKLLPLMIEESISDIPWSFDIPRLAARNKVQVPSLALIADSLNEIGYKCHRTHFSGSSVKTDAPEKELSLIIQSLKQIKK